MASPILMSLDPEHRNLPAEPSTRLRLSELRHSHPSRGWVSAGWAFAATGPGRLGDRKGPGRDTHGGNLSAESLRDIHPGVRGQGWRRSTWWNSRPAP